MEFRRRIVRTYPIIFKQGDEEDEDRQSEYSEASQFSKQWGWYHSIYKVSKGDINNFEQVTTLPIHKVFTFLSYEVQKDRIEYNTAKRQIKKARS